MKLVKNVHDICVIITLLCEIGYELLIIPLSIFALVKNKSVAGMLLLAILILAILHITACSISRLVFMSRTKITEVTEVTNPELKETIMKYLENESGGADDVHPGR